MTIACRLECEWEREKPGLGDRATCGFFINQSGFHQIVPTGLSHSAVVAATPVSPVVRKRRRRRRSYKVVRSTRQMTRRPRRVKCIYRVGRGYLITNADGQIGYGIRIRNARNSAGFQPIR